MIEFYAQIKLAHITLALVSGIFFATRGGAALMHQSWPIHGGVRAVSYVIDTCLLTAAMMLLTILPKAVFANGWLYAKLAFLVAYIALGVMVFRPALSRKTRVVCYFAALLLFGLVYSIARAHQPLGVLGQLFPA